MKKYSLFFAVIVTVFLSSCSGKYDSAISDYVLAVNGQNVEDVKIDNVTELKKITVADSIAYINQRTNYLLQQQIQEAKNQISSYQEDLVKISTGRSARVLVEAYTTQIVKVQQAIDSLKAITPAPTNLYDGRNNDDELAVIVECAYSTTDIATGSKVDKKENFVLSPDGKICYGTTDNVAMDPMM